MITVALVVFFVVFAFVSCALLEEDGDGRPAFWWLAMLALVLALGHFGWLPFRGVTTHSARVTTKLTWSEHSVSFNRLSWEREYLEEEVESCGAVRHFYDLKAGAAPIVLWTTSNYATKSYDVQIHWAEDRVPSQQ